eukprot:9044615-Alexandrium_andersonii.AAC.1
MPAPPGALHPAFGASGSVGFAHCPTTGCKAALAGGAACAAGAGAGDPVPGSGAALAEAAAGTAAAAAASA